MSSDVTDHKRTEKRVGLLLPFFFFFFSAFGHVMTRPLFLDTISLNKTLLFFSLKKIKMGLKCSGYVDVIFKYICGLWE